MFSRGAREAESVLRFASPVTAVYITPLASVDSAFSIRFFVVVRQQYYTTTTVVVPSPASHFFVRLFVCVLGAVIVLRSI